MIGSGCGSGSGMGSGVAGGGGRGVGVGGGGVCVSGTLLSGVCSPPPDGGDGEQAVKTNSKDRNISKRTIFFKSNSFEPIL